MKAPAALTIAGSDSSGGAGIQADLKTFSALGVYGMSAITALTAQNTMGVSAVHDVPAAFVREQIAQVMSDIPADAAKTGMLSNVSVVSAVAESVVEFAIDKLVVDPVFVSKNNDRLLSQDSVIALVEKLFPVACMITPNLHEASALAEQPVGSLDEMRKAAIVLKATGVDYVLVKGGHLQGLAVDVLYDGSTFTEFEAERIESRNTHGTGCTLSAAIAAYLARGERVEAAVEKAKLYVTGAIKNGLDLGAGYGPTNHGWNSTMAPGP